jgi:hypothetical protein
MGVEVVGCRVRENERDVGCFNPHGRHRAYVLDITCPLKQHGGVCGGCICGGADTKVEGVVDGEREIERGGAFGA